jgi:hypothetical protein
MVLQGFIASTGVNGVQRQQTAKHGIQVCFPHGHFASALSQVHKLMDMTSSPAGCRNKETGESAISSIERKDPAQGRLRNVNFRTASQQPSCWVS